MIGGMLQNKITAYWDIGTTNFGDLITPLLLKKYGFTPVHTSPDNSEVISTGSILQKMPEDYSGCILGSGLIKDTVRHFKNANILAVRGELTRQRIGASKNVVLGDPGLLASQVLKHRQSKSYTLGIVPHFLDKSDLRIRNFKRKYNRDVLLIDVKRQPLKVFEDIDKCEFILSSSLHGLIVADSLGIPNGWMKLSDNVIGKGFKFEDYNSAIKSRHVPLSLSGNETLSDLLKMTRRPHESIEEVKERLHGAFCSLRDGLVS
jgi:pyruvyltransferase